MGTARAREANGAMRCHALVLVAVCGISACGRQATQSLGSPDSTLIPDDALAMADTGLGPDDAGPQGPDTGAQGPDDTGLPGPEDTGVVGPEDTGTQGPDDTGTQGPDDTGLHDPPDAGLAGDALVSPDVIVGADVVPGRDTGLGPDGGLTPDAGGCTQDRDCGRGGGFNVFCEVMTGQCLECFQPQHCRNGQVCDVAGGNVCRVGCFAGNRCPPGLTCDTTGGICVDCLTSMDCNNGEVCNTTTRECVQCTSNSDCALRVGTPVCNPTSNTCVGCASDADCAMGVCDANLQRCVTSPTNRGLCEPCDMDGQCGGNGNLCIGINVGGQFLDRTCSLDCTNATCPSGFECIDVRAGTARQCRPRYAMQNPSCTAVSHLGDACPFSATTNDPGCGLSGRQDALCILAPGGTGGVCTIGCADANDCPTGFTCTGAAPGQTGVCL